MKVETSKGDFLRKQRIEKGVRLNEIATDIRMSKSSIYAIESGVRNLTTRSVEEIMYAIGIDDKYKKFLLYPDNLMSKSYCTQGEYLRLRRMDIGLNVSDLAHYIGISISMLSCIENGTRRVTKDIFQKLAKPLEIDVTYDEFIENGAMLYMVYSVDSEWNVPIIDDLYFKAEKAVTKRKELEASKDGSSWRVIEFKLIASEEKELVEIKEVSN